MTAQIKHFEHQIGIFETRGEKAPNQQKEVMKLRIDGKRVQMQSGRGWNVIHLIELSKKGSERKWTETMSEMRLSTVHVTSRDPPPSIIAAQTRYSAHQDASNISKMQEK